MANIPQGKPCGEMLPSLLPVAALTASLAGGGPWHVGQEMNHKKKLTSRASGDYSTAQEFNADHTFCVSVIRCFGSADIFWRAAVANV